MMLASGDHPSSAVPFRPKNLAEEFLIEASANRNYEPSKPFAEDGEGIAKYAIVSDIYHRSARQRISGVARNRSGL